MHSLPHVHSVSRQKCPDACKACQQNQPLLSLTYSQRTQSSRGPPRTATGSNEALSNGNVGSRSCVSIHARDTRDSPGRSGTTPPSPYAAGAFSASCCDPRSAYCRHLTRGATNAKNPNTHTETLPCSLTLEVAGEYVLSEQCHVSDAEGSACAGPHHDGRRLFLNDP